MSRAQNAALLFFCMILSELKGFGPKRLELLHELQIYSCEDLIRFYPHEYLNYNDISLISDVEDGQSVTIHAIIRSDPSIFYSKGKSIVSVNASDESGKITLRWFNQPYRINLLSKGQEYYITGKVSEKKGKVIYNPQLATQALGILPVYALKKGLTQSSFRLAVKEAIDQTNILDPLSEEIIDQYNLVSLKDALYHIHFPSSESDLRKSLYRLRFEDAFFYFLAVYSIKEQTKLLNGIAFDTEGILDRFLSKLPFTPTKAQLKVLKEVEKDMHSREPMNRLIQGDVGSGKTVIAEYALAVAAACNKQGVLLVPTEILAKQHFNNLKKMFGSAITFYSGGLTAKEKACALERIENGETPIVVGTHALLSDKVRFYDLGLVVTDEQHRFGVEQRAKIENKGIRPDVLVMSATPIPRTLALILYADLSLSVIDELPQGRKTVITKFVPDAKRKRMYEYISSAIKQNERAFVVCPLIEETEGFEGLSVEEIYDELRILLPDVSIGVLHGRMKDQEKESIMDDFKSGIIQILISTTVVEVGVDISEATYMVIEGADHFGLATLHQLRGRVGRCEKQAYCYMLSKTPSKTAVQRLNTMIESNDGFYLAQKDMELRGYGDLFGLKQSGEDEMSSFMQSCDLELIQSASTAAGEIMKTPSLKNNELIELARSRYLKNDLIARN